ncbi:precorrin-8X methylmutase [Natronobacterium gregoryi]|uniref:Precorrin isomerase n=2 Tax=Natronobacterium gregoryi TaxID=44930 RepID=L0AE04_NATGS|nr:precorrin-8X methylmutase [Natronobacterium gregoryi]AFZ71382.1 precorrin isomerase [Natronobacterium gregoryi SP2]ELY66907.1 precorrin-8X methylmutase CbiC/CobH [Natronobacterium gregoryi SP2]PLK21238.1 precorrin isomerase [Natronobacterium gregoryi SP2]SFI84992.1 precorrin-8X methylmutase [Natronobacterium gregoryi]
MTDGEYDREYADLGATTQEAMDIAETSMDIVQQFVPDETLADRVRQKSVHSMGDIEFQHLIRFTGTDDIGDDEDAPVRAGARAVLEEANVVTDITMAQAGITGRGHDCEKHKAIGHGADLAKETGITRTAAGVLELDDDGVYDGAIVTIGNAPTAAFTLADCIENGTRPAVVVATPVGFVKAEESRERIRSVSDEYGVPAITNVGRRGGSGLAAALTNELIHVATDARAGDIDLERTADARATEGRR